MIKTLKSFFRFWAILSIQFIRRETNKLLQIALAFKLKHDSRDQKEIKSPTEVNKEGTSTLAIDGGVYRPFV